MGELGFALSTSIAFHLHWSCSARVPHDVLRTDRMLHPYWPHECSLHSHALSV